MNKHISLSFGTDAPLIEVITTTRAMRRLEPEPVPRALLEELVRSATYGPSAGNNLTYQADHFDRTPALIIACYESRGPILRMCHTFGRQLIALRTLGTRHTLTMLRNLRRSMMVGEAASIYPGVQNLLLTARALGLAASMTTWHTMFEREVEAALGIPRHVKIYAIIPVGRPAGNFGPVTRRPLADAIHWQHW
ncbi:nitroreductase family protein [Nocardia goodfellowii]|uniref:Nitroreductase n=1 Tax=Nocardia goodfellowii TaxID=882446 RepID=A0ABS4QIN1_9NOCA|nr:nitroreductase family protein [Nocardia goodfellowii]MBP2191550.1 nitroreductase [Nocardia goodfellowii]